MFITGVRYETVREYNTDLKVPDSRLDVGALIISVGFGGALYYNNNKEPPQNPILIS